MKKLLLTTAAVLLTVGVYAQGTVNFANASSTPGLNAANRQVTFGPTASQFNAALAAGANVSSNYAGVNLVGLRAALLYAPSTVTDLTQFSLASFTGGYPTLRVSTSAYAGTWFAKTATLDTIGAGVTANMVAVVWDTAFAASPLEAAAKNGLYGTSAIFQYTPPSGSTPAPAEFLPQNLGAFSIGSTVVPEPTSFALLGLGAAAMLILRRRS
jgi:hypothetical protein